MYVHSPSNICARQSLDYLNSEYLQLFAFGRGMNYGFWCFGSNVLVRMCRPPPQITTRAAQDFCGMAPTVPSSNEESQYFTAGISFFFRQKRRRSRGLQIKVERSKIETSLEGGASRE